MTHKGAVKPKASGGKRGRVGQPHASSAQARQPVPLLQLLAGGDPPSGADVRAVSVSLRNVKDLLFEHGIDICHETARL